MMDQLTLFDKKEPIETVTIQPNKEMPLDVFKSFHRISYFMELMKRTPEGFVIWDEDVTSIYSEEMAEVEYHALQEDYFTSTMELPKKIVDSFK